MNDESPVLESGETLHTEDGEVFTLTHDGHIVSMMQGQPQETAEQLRALAGFDEVEEPAPSQQAGSAHPVEPEWDEPILCSCAAYASAYGSAASDPDCITHGYRR